VIFLSTVEDAFQISGRGCVVVAPRSSLQLHVRDSIQLRKSDGQILDTYVAAIEMLCGPDVRPDIMAFQLPTNVNKQDVPKGTEIWLVKEASQDAT
jgi:translation elongation factor EF-Tu-like GTPase